MKEIHLNLNRRETVALAVIVGASILFFAPIGVSAVSPKCGRGAVPIDNEGQFTLIDTSASPQKEIKKVVFDPLQGLQDMFQNVIQCCKHGC